jgi:flavin-binding protein dodecin
MEQLSLTTCARKRRTLHREAQRATPAMLTLPSSSLTETSMPVAKVSEITSTSATSFEDAIQKGIARAHKTLRNVKGAWVASMKVDCDDGKITEYRVNLKVTFVLND